MQQKRSDTMTVGKIFTSMLSTLKGFGPETISRMNESFSSMRELYEFMQRQDNYGEKLNFIDSLNQKQAELLVKLLDPENADKYKRE